MYEVNEKVVHCPEGVCIVEDICDMKVEKQIRKMYKLRSIVNQEKTLYIPVESEKIHVRNLKSREEIEQILASEPDESSFMKQNISKRTSIQNRAIYEDNSMLLMKLIKLYLRRKEQSKLSVGDKNWLKTAEQLLFSEVAVVLECEYSTFVQNNDQMISRA